MSLRVWVPWHPQPVSAAGTVLSSFFSLTTHAALFAVVAGSAGSAAARGGTDARVRGSLAPLPSDGERLHWVGLGGGSGTTGTATTRRDTAPPPVAYVVPGRGALRYHVLHVPGRRPRAPGLTTPRDAARGATPRAAPALDARPPVPPPNRAPRRTRLPALPDVALPDPEATLLVAGVVSAAPDLVRRVSRPEDFVPVSELDETGKPVTGTALISRLVLKPQSRVDELPVPLVTNPLPTYPDSLERLGVGGRVEVEFEIDSTGAIDMGSLRVVQSTHALLTQAVRGVLPLLRFVPAQFAEHPIGVTVRQPFVFKVRARR